MIDKENIKIFYFKYKFIIFSIAVILSCLILIALVIYPQLLSLLEKRRVHQEITQKTEILVVKANELESINEEELSKKIENITLALPPDQDYTSAINVLQNIISENGFSLVSMQLSQSSVAVPNLKGFSIKIETIGPRLVFSNLLNSIENASRVMKVSGLELTSQRRNDEVSASITVDVYFAPLPTTLGASDSPLSKLTENEEEIVSKLSQNIKTNGFNASSGLSGSLPSRGKLNPF